MPRKKSEKTVQVSIKELSKDGNGVGVWEESPTPVEVPFTCPGDVVLAKIRNKRSGKYHGQLLEVLQPSKERIQPRCIHFGYCGGCRWQHFSYERQLQLKQLFLQNILAPLLTAGVTLLPIMPCESPWAYRNKMEFSFSSDKKGNRFLGLMLEGSRGKVFNLTECHLVNPWMAEALKAVREWWADNGLTAYHPPTNQGSLRTLTLREGLSSGDRLAMLTVSGNPDFALSKPQLEAFTAYLRASVEPIDPQLNFSVFLRIQQILKGKPTEFYEMKLYGAEGLRETLNGLYFMVSPSSFFQPNSKQAEKIYQAALEMANVRGEEVVYDLYCGTGTLGISFAKHVKQVIGVEISEESALDARTNASINGLKNVTIFGGSCAAVLHKIREEKNLPKPDIVLLDPPRAGLDEKALEELLMLDGHTLIYISCNPISQARDLKALLEKGYRLIKIQPVDQFPQTIHLETVALLKKVAYA